MKYKPFFISGPGIYNKDCPRFHTREDAYNALREYAKMREQSFLLFSVYKELEDGSSVLV